MDVGLFDFDLPEDLIALRPASPRDAARMLVVREDGEIVHAHVRDLPDYLRAGDALVVNDTRVIPARLYGRRLPRADGSLGAAIEILLLERTAAGQYRALARRAKRLQIGDALTLGKDLRAHVVARYERGEVLLKFGERYLGGNLWESTNQLHNGIIEQGEMPLPPYIAGKRAADAQDRRDYQTLFARYEGSVAAPTAGLHFTDDLLKRLSDTGVSREQLTLHVGAGTFLPVSATDTTSHRMHAEWAELDAATAERLNATRAKGGRIVAVGTTSLRTLETAAQNDGAIKPFRGETDIFITPGYRFKTAEILLTNFHLPRSTLFMLVSAFMGVETMERAYAEAIAQRYRFYSYGDACLLLRSLG